MIADLKPYDQYRECEIEWLDTLPATWTVERAKWTLKKVDRLVRPGDEVVTCFRDGQVTLRKNRRISGFTEATAEIGYQGIRRGDLVIHQMDAFAGAVGVSDSDGKATPVYSVCVPVDDAMPEYYAALVREMSRKGWIEALAKGIRERSTDFRFETFKNLLVPIPPRSEQEAIIRFLVYLNRRIDRFVQSKRKLIALLEEQKQSVINQAVTKGLEADAPLKPSGIQWLGDIPAHWEVKPFVRLAIERADYRGATPTKVESGVTLVTARNVKPGYIDYEISKEFVRHSEYATIMRRGLPRTLDILLTMEAPLGNIALVDREDIALAQRLIRFRLDENEFAPKFAVLSLNAAYFQNQLLCRATGSTAQGMKASKLPQLLCVVPPPDEQVRIEQEVVARTSSIEAALTRTKSEIILIEEYRTGLISDVVTGQLDVRGAQVPDTYVGDRAIDELLGERVPEFEEEVEFAEAEA